MRCDPATATQLRSLERFRLQGRDGVQPPDAKCRARTVIATIGIGNLMHPQAPCHTAPEDRQGREPPAPMLTFGTAQSG